MISAFPFWPLLESDQNGYQWPMPWGNLSGGVGTTLQRAFPRLAADGARAHLPR